MGSGLCDRADAVIGPLWVPTSRNSYFKTTSVTIKDPSPSMTTYPQVLMKLVNAFQVVNQLVASEKSQGSLERWSITTMQKFENQIRKAQAIVDEEEAFFSGTADLSGLTEDALQIKLSDIRETARKLAIVLSGGLDQFRDNSNYYASLSVFLNTLATFFAPNITTELDDNLKNFINSTALPLEDSLYGAQQLDVSWKFLKDFKEVGGNTSTAAEGLKKLSEMCAQLGAELKQQAETRADKKDQKAKQARADKVTAGAKKLLPLLRSHVLRVGLGKGLHLNISSGGANVSLLCNVFPYSEVENAHRQVENARDLVQQEITIRRLRNREVDGSRPKKKARGSAPKK